MSFTDPNEAVPSELTTAEFTLRPVTADDAALDFDAVMESREHLRLWEQSTWPEDDFTVEANRVDLTEMERRHAAHRAFSYTVLTPEGDQCLGCVYMFPTDASFLAKSTVTPIGTAEWDRSDAVVYFWVRSSGMENGMDARLLQVLRDWFRTQWRLQHPVFVTSEPFTQQVSLFEHTDLELLFELQEPDKAGSFLVYG